jgi:septal ring factor EnvC (AmiA/AmiB activator)
MLTLIKQTWSEWKDLKIWLQVLILLPLIVLTLLGILYFFFPGKLNKLEEELLNQNRKTTNRQVKILKKEEKKLDKEQKEVKENREVVKEKIIDVEQETETLIKDIDNAGSDIDKLLSIHKRLNSRKSTK